MSPSKGQQSPIRVSMVGVEGLRFCLHAWDPPRRRRTTPTLVLPGVGGRGLDFAVLAGLLRSDRTVFAADLPGCGDSERRGPYDAVQVAERVAALVLHLADDFAGDARVDVVGHGMGGNVAIALASGRPDLVRRLVVVNAPYRTRHAPWPRSLPDLRARGPVDLPSVPHLADLRVRAAWHRGHLATRLALGEVHVDRVLQVWGTDDRWLTPRTAGIVFRDLAAGTPDARQVTVAGGGHRPHLTDPHVVASVVAEFLRSA
jgi:pimeloyl-ACP methyl ester carboxylesterase